MWPGSEVTLGCSIASNVVLISGKCLVNKKSDVRSYMQGDSVPSCDHFGRHGEWKKYLVTKILAKGN